MKKLLISVSFASVVLISACTRYTPNIYNVKNAQVVGQTTKPLSLSQVGHAIAAGGTSLGWNMNAVRPGYTVGTLDLRGNQAKVGIRYNSKTYSIKYLSSKNLMKDGEIHKNYNGWIHNLDNAIKSRLLMSR
jgi:hypothetical protein